MTSNDEYRQDEIARLNKNNKESGESCKAHYTAVRHAGRKNQSNKPENNDRIAPKPTRTQACQCAEAKNDTEILHLSTPFSVTGRCAASCCV